jgi:hypothetical protein
MWEEMNGPSCDLCSLCFFARCWTQMWPRYWHFGIWKGVKCVSRALGRNEGESVNLDFVQEQHFLEFQGTTDSRAKAHWEELCQSQDSSVDSCKCTKFVSATLEGEISCAVLAWWSDDVDQSFTGSATYAITLVDQLLFRTVWTCQHSTFATQQM